MHWEPGPDLALLCRGLSLRPAHAALHPTPPPCPRGYTLLWSLTSLSSAGGGGISLIICKEKKNKSVEISSHLLSKRPALNRCLGSVSINTIGSKQRVPFSTMSVVVLYKEKSVSQVTVSSLTTGSYLANLVTHLFIQSFTHETIHPSIQTATCLPNNCTRQRLRWCSKDESRMDHTQAVGGSVNCRWVQADTVNGGCRV